MPSTRTCRRPWPADCPQVGAETTDTGDVRAERYDEIVQRLSTAVLAREMGRDDLADSNIRAALEVAKSLATGEIDTLLAIS